MYFLILILVGFMQFFFYNLSSLGNFEIFLFLSTDENSNVDISSI